MAAGPALTRPAPRRHLPGPVLVFGVATVVSFSSLVVSGVNRADEVWNLHLIHRMLQGDVLYTDIRYFPTPLALFLGVGAASMFGAKLVVLKALIAVSFGVTVTASLFIARMLFAGSRARVLLVITLLLFGLPPPSSLYNTLVISFLSVTAALVLRWDDALGAPPSRGRTRRLFWLSTAVGVAAGACCLTKYNIGAAAAVAVAGSMVVPLVQRRLSGHDFVASGCTAAGAWLVTVLAGITPVLLQGAGGDFVRQLLDGGSLLDAPVPYQDGWRKLVEGVARLSMLETRTLASYALVPISALMGALAIAKTRAVVRGRLLMVGLFAVASVVLAVPRADHLIWAVPLPLALLLGSAAQMLRQWTEHRPLTAVAVPSWCFGFALSWLGLAVGSEVVAARQFEMVRSGPFHGALLPPGQWGEIVRDAAVLRAQVGPDGKVLILRPEAGLYYLVGGMRNPTPYDYPDAFEFGATGVTELRTALADQTVRFTCIGRDYPRQLEPEQVIATVQARAWLIARLPGCDLWRTNSDMRRRSP
ncbi:MAG TPA: hypothetical protein VGV86_13450 [Acidimicrobiales bacterium]|nr:hypothetical protein [Acidimicrobiales bacterium]